MVAVVSDVAVGIDLDGPVQAVICLDRMIAIDSDVMAVVDSYMGMMRGGCRRPYGVEGCKSQSDGGTNCHEVEANAVGRPAQSSRITFDKDNPTGSVLIGAAAKDSELAGTKPDSIPVFRGN